jgi:hypothetical protein
VSSQLTLRLVCLTANPRPRPGRVWVEPLSLRAIAMGARGLSRAFEGGELHARLSEAEPRVRPGDALPSGRHDPDRRCADLPSTQGTHRRPDDAEHVVENERGVERAVRAVHVEFDRGVAGRVQADERRRGSGRNRVVEPTGHEHDAALAELFVEPGGVLPSARALRHGSSRVRGPFDHPAPRYPSGAKLVASITALISPWARQVGL